MSRLIAGIVMNLSEATRSSTVTPTVIPCCRFVKIL
jgi:hypothetical protein